MSLGPAARRRISLYGGAAVFAALALWAIPTYVSRRVPGVPVRRMQIEADAAMDTEAVKLLQEYVRLDTTNPPGLTRPAIEFLARTLECKGIPVTITGADPERPILVARLKGRTAEGALALHNHVDVVPAGDLAAWRRPPFAADRGEGAERDHLYGRGTLDMKGQTIANILALGSLVSAGVVPRRDIVFVAESGEETYDESLGMMWLFDHRPDLLQGVTDVFNEGGVNEVKTQQVERFGIEVMQKAILSVDVLSKQRKPLEDFEAFLKTEEANTPIRVVPAVREFLRFIAPSRSDVWGRRMMDEAEKLGPGTEFWQYVPEVYRALLKDSIYLGTIKEDAQGFSTRPGRWLDARLQPPPARRHGDRGLSAEPRRGARLSGGGRRLRSGPGSRPRRALHSEQPVHVVGGRSRAGPQGLRRVALRREHLRRPDDPSRERAHFAAALHGRNRADAAHRSRVRDSALSGAAATLRSSGRWHAPRVLEAPRAGAAGHLVQEYR